MQQQPRQAVLIELESCYLQFGRTKSTIPDLGDDRVREPLEWEEFITNHALRAAIVAAVLALDP